MKNRVKAPAEKRRGYAGKVEVVKRQLLNRKELPANHVQAVDYTLALGRTRDLESVGIVAEQLLVDSCCAADGSHGCKGFRVAKKSGGRQGIYDLVIAGGQPFGHLIAVLDHRFYMEAEGFFKILLYARQCLISAQYSSYSLIAPATAEVFLRPAYFYVNNISHITIYVNAGGLTPACLFKNTV